MDAEHAHLFYERGVTVIAERTDPSPPAYKSAELSMRLVSLYHEPGGFPCSRERMRERERGCAPSPPPRGGRTAAVARVITVISADIFARATRPDFINPSSPAAPAISIRVAHKRVSRKRCRGKMTAKETEVKERERETQRDITFSFSLTRLFRRERAMKLRPVLYCALITGKLFLPRFMHHHHHCVHTPVATLRA